MDIFRFVRSNFRWLAGGLNLTFFSSFGQTFFIAMFAAEIRSTFDISHGEFGWVYMIGTLASAIALVFIGKVVDFRSIREVSLVVILALATACIVMASATNVPMLILAVFLLRLSGQGMMSHTAITAMGKWFNATRGRAVTITGSGHQIGEGLLPFVILAALSAFTWREIWVFCAVTLCLVAVPISRLTFQLDRKPQSDGGGENSEIGRQWTRAEAVRDLLFWIVVVGMLAPSFIGTSVWFHQVHLMDVKAWPRNTMAQGFAVLSITAVVVSLLTGWIIDKLDAYRLLPVMLLPLAVACLVLFNAESSYMLLLFMFLTALTYGLYNGIFGAIWAEIYGTRHLGAIRAIVFAGMVFSSALGPGVTGGLIDHGITFEAQLYYMGIITLGICFAFIPVTKRLHRRFQLQLSNA